MNGNINAKMGANGSHIDLTWRGHVAERGYTHNQPFQSTAMSLIQAEHFDAQRGGVRAYVPGLTNTAVV